MPAAEETISQHPELLGDLQGAAMQRDTIPIHLPYLKKLLERSKMLSTIEKVLYLKNIEIFNEIPAEELTQVARLTRETKVSTGEYLIHEGEAGVKLFIILDGKIEVLKSGTRIAELGANAVIGEMSLLSDISTTADCRATTRVNALTINKEDFRRLLYSDHPEIALGLLRVLSDRLERTTRELRECKGKTG
jgi:signal-transduction protein with cAMP-binding, CBS, and nucleotidyltransferase domain